MGADSFELEHTPESLSLLDRVEVIDSHTGGEPTRVVVAGGPDLGQGTVAQQLAKFRQEHDDFRASVVNEPRGSDVLVGALLCKPANTSCAAGVIFFNNVGYLGMCGHGSIGVAVTLAHLGRLSVGASYLETPVGVVKLSVHDRNRVSVDNVASYRHRKNLTVNVPNIGPITGDIAWGGNWFFLVGDHGQVLDYENVDQLSIFTWAIREALGEQGIRGANGEIIDHIELFGPPADPSVADSRNFVMCPGKAYDRSPCGTGTSAKVACLVEDGQLQAGARWRQQGITGSVFEATAHCRDNKIFPTIRGSAYITGQSTLLFDRNDPFRLGIVAS
ncbi:MAG TPA: proline racemase family protein [Woeseiaceae bacterium]|nr:proline racemase family protein [Woeseiaceae bacterium]